jgi:hypothetical protein
MRDLLRFGAGLAADLLRSRTGLVAENGLLRQQLIVAERKTLLLQPTTILRWHRAGFRLFWRRRSRRLGRPPTRAASLIRQMATSNPRWGAERIRGELRKLGIRVAKRTSRRSASPQRSVESCSTTC